MASSSSSMHPLWHGLAASSSAVLSSLVLSPLDLIKTRVQDRSISIAHKETSFALISRIARQEGVFSLWRGLSPSLMMSVPSMGLYFSIYESMKQYLISNHYSSALAASIFAASIGRTVCAFVTTPLELIRTNLQASRSSSWSSIINSALGHAPIISKSPSSSSCRSKACAYFSKFPPRSPASRPLSTIATSPSFSHPVCLSSLSGEAPCSVAKKSSSSFFSSPSSWDLIRHRVSSISRLWIGLTPTLLRDVPFSAIYWSSYEWTALQIRSWIEIDGQPMSASQKLSSDILAGSLCGTVAALITTPADVIKTQQQTSIMIKPSSAHVEAISTWDRARMIWRSEGPRGFFRGVGPRLVKVAPACGITIASYEFMRAYIQDYVSATPSK